MTDERTRRFDGDVGRGRRLHVPRCFFAGVGMTLLVGCASRGDVEVLEARLRAEAQRVQNYERELEQVRADLASAQREADLLREQMASSSQNAIPEELTQALARAVGVQFNTLISGGRDTDGLPGDDELHLVFFPHDAHDEVVKLSGTVAIEAFDLSRDGEEQRIGRWEFSPDESRKLWHHGFLASGFFLNLPWQESPRVPKVLVHGRLTTVDGRQFDATQTISIEPASPTAAPGRTPLIGESRAVPSPYEGEPEIGPRVAEGPQQEEDGVKPASLTVEAPPPVATLNSLRSQAQQAVRGQPKPFPANNGLETSDRWTVDTIPRLR